jgi:hypothetical protein
MPHERPTSKDNEIRIPLFVEVDFEGAAISDWAIWKN